MNESKAQKFRVEIPISDDAHRVISALLMHKNDAQAFVVGGYIRDFLMDLNPHDEDITTNLNESEIISALSNADIPTKLKASVDTFGVVFACLGGKTIEIAPFRKDIYTNDSDGRHPSHVASATIYEDAARRDFSVNNLYYDTIDRVVLDFNDSVQDIHDRDIRCVGNPIDRFNEDKLRILRFFRFHHRYNEHVYHYDRSIEMDKAIREFRTLDGITAERIQDEFCKGISQSKDSGLYVYDLYKFGLFPAIFPGLNVHTGFFLNDETTNNISVVLALMLSNVPSNTINSSLNALKYPNSISVKVQKLVEIRNYRNSDNESPYYKLIKNAEGLRDELTELSKFVVNKRVRHLIDYVPPKIDGNELIEQGFRGTEIGVEIRRLVVEHYNQSWSAFNANR